MRNTQNKSNFESTTSSTTDWDNVNWNKTEKYVDKLQKRIYDAESKGDSRKVRDTQRILIHSKWIKNKYYPLYDDGHHRTNWILTGPKEKNHLFRMDWLPIKRWIMIKNNFSPYDRTKTEYFLNRELKTFKFR